MNAVTVDMAADGHNGWEHGEAKTLQRSLFHRRNTNGIYARPHPVGNFRIRRGARLYRVWRSCVFGFYFKKVSANRLVSLDTF